METVLKALLKNKALIGLAVSLLTAQLITLIKNPMSDNVKALRFGVERLHGACEQFLAALPEQK